MLKTTIPSWRRATKREKERAVKFLKTLPVEFSCDCVACNECHDPRTVTWWYFKKDKRSLNPHMDLKFMNYCPACSMPKIDGMGRMYPTTNEAGEFQHTKFCDKNSEWIPNPKSKLNAIWDV